MEVNGSEEIMRLGMEDLDRSKHAKKGRTESTEGNERGEIERGDEES